MQLCSQAKWNSWPLALAFEQNLGWIIVDCDKLRPPLYPQTPLSTPAPFPFFGDARNEIMIRSLN